MTLIRFHKLRVGDQLVNKRSPGIVLTITNRWVSERDGDTIEVETSSGKTRIHELRHEEYQQAYRQERFRL